MNSETKLTAKNYATDQEVRWCPGCGDYAILKAVQKTFADLALNPDNTVVISGIGCAARFPYYLETYGFHTIHGRAAAIATGTKLANPDLDVWVVSGDGDALSIGGNHFIHLLRRNLNLQFLLFNNEIYGLTKGQYSPTSRTGTISPSSPHGSSEKPVHAASLTLASGGTFFARTTDVGVPHLIEILKEARQHQGTSMIEILQNCIVYNDAVHSKFTEKKHNADSCIFLSHGKPLIFGKDNEKGLRLNPKNLTIEVVYLTETNPDSILVHDETNLTLAEILGRMDGSELPLALGVLYRTAQPVFESVERDILPQQPPTLERVRDLLNAGSTWTVE